MIVVLVFVQKCQTGFHHIVMHHGHFATAGCLLWSDNATVRGDVAESLETMNQSVQRLQIMSDHEQGRTHHKI